MLIDDLKSITTPARQPDLLRKIAERKSAIQNRTRVPICTGAAAIELTADNLRNVENVAPKINLEGPPSY